MILNSKTLTQLIFVFILFSSIDILNAQPTKKDYFRTLAELGLFLSIEYDLMNLNSVQNKNFNHPNKFDTYFRNKMLWNNQNVDKAKFYSDILLYGVVLGSIPASPLISKKNNYRSMILANIEVLAINGLITDITKYIVGRQRPYSYFKTNGNDKESFKSFFSGHTSSAFAIGTSSAIMLSDEYPDKKTLIWSSFYTIASATGYFRIAADKHYLTDVIMGAIVGSSVGYLTQKLITKSYFSINAKPTITNYRNFQINWSF